MVNTYMDFVAVLEIEIQKLQDAEDYLNEAGKVLLKAYRKIRNLTSFVESCEELLEVGVEIELEEDEKKAASLALKAIRRVAKTEIEEAARKDLVDQLNGVPSVRLIGDVAGIAEHGSRGGA